ncbi:YiaA/YiaB family inner membrane protein [Actinomadura sp. LOL_016]|uniref:YiaA/YiaB family inner membrane protein n=1 Tax=unclassified Actinomadura TaxID=2626254 RepID=UPI003A8001ED
MTTRSQPPVPPGSTAFFVQAAISFVVSGVAVVLGVLYLPVDEWVRAFLALGVLYVITSTFTLAKCVRDRQETQTLTGRVDQARLDKLLSEHDPYSPQNL